MEIFLKEHGRALLGAVTGGIVIGMTMTALIILNIVMPVYNNCVSSDNSKLVEEVRNFSPTIECDELMYVSYGNKGFNVKEYVKAKDYNGTDISDEIEVKGEVNTKKKGLYSLTFFVQNSLGYSAKKELKVIVE